MGFSLFFTLDFVPPKVANDTPKRIKKAKTFSHGRTQIHTEEFKTGKR